MNCIFCDIVAGKITSSNVYEDDNILAFLDVSPINYGHILVIPKNHYTNMEEIPEKELALVINVVKKIGLALKKGLNVEGYNIQVNNGVVAGQVVPHLHFHVIPRLENDGLRLWPGGRYGDGELEEMAKNISEEVN